MIWYDKGEKVIQKEKKNTYHELHDLYQKHCRYGDKIREDQMGGHTRGS